MIGNIFSQGFVEVTHQQEEKAPLLWRIRNASRYGYWKGFFSFHLAKWFSRLTDIPTLTSQLSIRHCRNGQWTDYGVVSYRLVTDVGVAFLVDDWDANGQDISTMNYHGCGTGTNAEAAGDTALQTESTTALNPDNTRATGTRAQPAANQYRTTGTVIYDNSAAITEHGLFSAATTGTGVLWDRSIFSAVNVISGDSVAFAYTCTVNSGG